MRENGVQLTAKTSIALVESNASSFYFDFYNKTLYVHTSGGDSPNNYLVEGLFWLYFTNYQDGTIIYNDHYYWPFLSSKNIPDITQEITPFYEGSFSISAGRISLINGKLWGSHYFDRLYDRYVWRGAVSRLLAGGLDFSYSDFNPPLFTAMIEEVSCTDGMIYFDMRDIREDMDRMIPVSKFWKENYPSLDDSLVGLPIPFYFGVQTDVPAVCIDKTNRKFLFHGGRAKSVSAVKKNGTSVTIDTDCFIDYQRGIVVFSRDNYPLEDGDVITVDFEGLPNSAKVLITNGADIFKYMMNEWLEIETADLDLDSIYETKYVSTVELAVPLYKELSFFEIIRRLENSLRAFTFQDGEGKIGLRAVQTVIKSNAVSVMNHHTREFSQTKNRSSVFREINIFYAEAPKTEGWSVRNYIDNTAHWKYGSKNSKDFYTFLRTESAATALLNSWIEDMDKDFISFRGPSILLSLLPGDLFYFSRDRYFSQTGSANNLTMRVISVQKFQSALEGFIKAEEI